MSKLKSKKLIHNHRWSKIKSYIITVLNASDIANTLIILHRLASDDFQVIVIIVIRGGPSINRGRVCVFVDRGGDVMAGFFS